MHKARAAMPFIPVVLLLGLCFVYPVAEVLKWGFHDGSWTARYIGTVGRPEYIRILLNTVQVAVVTSVSCMVLGYPVAYVISRQRAALRTVLLIAIVVTMWVSVLIRTYAWMVVLGREGIINNVLAATGIIDEPVQLMFTTGAVYVAMIQTLLPISILASFSGMAGFDQTLLRAARAFGASKWGGFRTVFFPLTIDGVIAGGLLVLLMSLGFFITPALVGGPSDILIANVISDHVNQTLNWNLAAALSAVLLVIGTAMVLAVLIVTLGVRRFHKRAL
ncbi:ABC transporter permease [Roseovarius indicus]|uniref:Putrescine transport system permease protein PotH n=2 Tax=Roseovarius indicus TaxID=540747 RepID=A0A0T5PCG3_9RHOB|nr:ABC transporter permease [Roseovarius indicus]KRS18655.1 hypothetical protein XM52_07765 [Roseovarius indicus]QEW25698.1 Putrescine transport system permease protein PotH [Roseovarius indicus]SFE00217.1 putative spermidine/putrescine transport system permease protein [Roseovarius indicus]